MIKEQQICWTGASLMSFSEENEDGVQTTTGIIFIDIAKNRGIRYSVGNNRNSVRF